MPPGQSLPSARHSVPSPDGSLVATLQRARLLIRSAADGTLVQSWPLPQDFVIKCSLIRWYHRRDIAHESDVKKVRRIQLTDGQNIRIFDVEDPEWKASVENVAAGLGQVSDVDWSFNPNEVLVFSDFGVKLTIWSLTTGRGVEIRDPKGDRRCYDLKSKLGYLAILTRPSNQDVLMLIDPRTHAAVRSLELGTVDALEIQWSADGNWIAVRDTASAGYRVQILTADGHLFRTFTGTIDSGEIDLGVKCMTWSPAGALILGDFNGQVTVLNQKTFSPLAILHHTIPLELEGKEVWEEQIKANGERIYVCLSAPATPPASSTFSKTNPAKQGIAVLALNGDGTMLATRDDAAPSTVWIWSMQSNKPVTAIIHHSPIRHLAWHQTQKDLLLIHCAVQEPIVHLWKSNWIMPLVVTLPLSPVKGRLEAYWLQSGQEEHFKILLSSQTQTTDARISLAGDLVTDEERSISFKSSGQGPEDMFDEGNSLELSPVKLGNTEDFGYLYDENADIAAPEQALEDTFHYRKRAKATG